MAFARRELNLLKIESRPSRERRGVIVFYLDLQASLKDANTNCGARRTSAIYGLSQNSGLLSASEGLGFIISAKSRGELEK